MSRQIIAIRQELDGLQGQITTVSDALQRANENDDLNKTFFDEQNAIADAYYDEKRSLTGQDPGRITEDDFTNSKKFQPNSMFFPCALEPVNNVWKYLIPKIAPEVNGGNAVPYSPNENAAVTDLLDAYTVLTVGFNDAAGTTTLTAAYTPGSGILQIAAAMDFQDGDHLVIKTAPAVPGQPSSPPAQQTLAIFRVASGGGTTSLTVNEIAAPATTIPIGAEVSSTFAGYSNGERQGSGDAIMDGIEATIDQEVVNWQSALTAQPSAIDQNGDIRTIQLSQLNAEEEDIQTALSVISTWQALPAIGSGGRYTNAGFAPLMNERSHRSGIVTSRSSEIDVAMGQVRDNDDGTYGGTAGDIAYDRYQWIESRLHRAWGTAIEVEGLSMSSNVLQSRQSGLMRIFSDYETYMAAQPFMKDGDGTKELAIEDASAFSIGDTVYLLDDATAEVQRIIIGKEGNTLYLSDIVSVMLEVRENARVYKVF